MLAQGRTFITHKSLHRNGISDSRVRKRARLSSPRPSHTIELWWGAQSSDTFIANSLPPLPSLAASGPAPPPSSSRSQDHPAGPTTTKRRKKRRPKPAPPRPRSLLAMMNANISTQRRMRRTHAKFAALSAAAAAANNASGEDGESGDVPTTGPAAGSAGDEGADDAEADAVDERPWPVPRQSRKSILDGLIDPKPDIGELAAEKCMQWVNRKILEHVGFQGASGLLSEIHGSPSCACLQGHRSWRWMYYQISQWSICQTSGVPSASISISIPI
jgi:transcriptional activator SPT7